ncbi:unnamed protein product, partial [Tetraodon nigroviridis]
QLAQARQEAEVAESRAQQLREQVEDLQEKVAAQAAGNHGDVSLLSELEASLEAADLGVSEEEMKQEMGSILQLLLPLARDPSSSEGSEGADQRGDLQIMLQQLKGVAETLTQTARAQNILLQQENTELRNHLVSAQEKAGIVHQAIRDRDEAISKKNLMEVELVRSKNDMMSLNNQLLEAIQRKLELSQELEAWQAQQDSFCWHATGLLFLFLLFLELRHSSRQKPIALERLVKERESGKVWKVTSSKERACGAVENT